MERKEHSGTTSRLGQVPQSSPISRILSGSVGSLVYVLAFTPLEVVKIRQQAASAPSSSSHSPVKAFLRGRGAVMLNNGLMIPKSAFPCLVAPQYHVSPANICSRLFESASCHAVLDKPRGIFSTLLSISRIEGRAGLYAGLKPTLLQAIPNTAIYFTAYDEITMRLRRNHAANEASEDDAKRQVYIPLVAGATARLIASMATAPLELVRTRQASSVGNSNGVLEEFRFLLRRNGPFALYSGVGPMIMRDVPFSAIYFLHLETFKNLLSDSSVLGPWGVRHYQECGMKAPTSVEVMQSFLSGAAAGAIATIMTTPFDVIKTRRQMVGQAEASAATATGDHRFSQGMFQHMRQIVQEEGFFAGLWKGNQTRLVKVAPGCAIIISCYELGKKILADTL
mmetsp:Transcript_24648/g.53170  ORF Transcript_24648/g.53170 Transcript_24648/m.53170 type:complete len:396 (-) Transcript_24648:71-1258(-)|eukprot:CAMPEP_0172323358 /NCGR_PEP_ID=MMETSP1058-20130122/48503_1 /TAXON_ID=83371 /ORGANISM="Detonula confervacea, Strain CCMP 353" /LENGTH=395 /DNA_ID=CAMNT_0013039331 /DNA_START=51 /DNA_END=1238 /DNA_ORIENTATION=-